MGDEDEEPTYKLFVKGSDAPRAEGSKWYTGDAKAHFANGDEYEGTFNNGMRSSKGVYKFKKNGDSYEGYYELNKKAGFGKMTYRDLKGDDEEAEEEKAPRGGEYLGMHKQGKRSGEGTFTYQNGDVYVGEWVDGKKHGKGTYTYGKDETQMVGEWENGKITSGKWVFPNGTFYSGKFRYNKPHGKGVWVFANGNQLTGEYQQKEQENPDEAGGDEEEGAVKPDPKVWCNFKHGQNVAVQGGTMFYQKFGA